MFEFDQNVESLATFQAQTDECLERLRSSGEPLVLTIDGQAAVVIQDANAYRRLAVVDALKAGLASIDAGRTKPARETMLALTKEFGFDSIE